MNTVLKIIARVKRRIKKPKVGDYVFASKWRDASPNDGWCVGIIKEIKNERYYMDGMGKVAFRYARLISAEEGRYIVYDYPKHERARYSA